MKPLRRPARRRFWSLTVSPACSSPIGRSEALRSRAAHFWCRFPMPMERSSLRKPPPFVIPPCIHLRFPALIVASTDDPYGTLDHATSCAIAWSAGLVVAGALGHINGASRLGHWPQGMALFSAFRSGAGG